MARDRSDRESFSSATSAGSSSVTAEGSAPQNSAGVHGGSGQRRAGSPEPRPIRKAAAVLLWRKAADGREVFWVQRSRKVSLGGGFYAFPGGAIDPADFELARKEAQRFLDVESPEWSERGVLLESPETFALSGAAKMPVRSGSSEPQDPSESAETFETSGTPEPSETPETPELPETSEISETSATSETSETSEPDKSSRRSASFASPGPPQSPDLSDSSNSSPDSDSAPSAETSESSELKRAAMIAAVRELFEETGVLLASGSFDSEKLEALRQALLEETLGFEQVLVRAGARLDLSLLQEAGRWITPDLEKVRFDARFFVAELPEEQGAKVWKGELVRGEWLSPAKALNKWRKGQALLHPPALHLLQCLERFDLPEALKPMCNPPHVVEHIPERIEFQAGILMLPLRTPTLKPATHTNCYLVGDEELVVIDPGSPYAQEQEKLARLCRQLQQEGRRIREIWLSHEHPDHVGGVTALQRELQVPVRAHPETIRRLKGLQESLALDSPLPDGEVFAPPGELGLRLRAVFTPGHARGHLCFLEENSKALFAGDMVAGIGTIVVNPPEGDMADYIASLKRLQGLQVGAIYPSHGPVIPNGQAKLAEYLEHRAQREAQVVKALKKSKGGTLAELVALAYPDVPAEVHPLASRSLEAILDKLFKEGRVAVDEAGFYRLSPRS